MAYFPFQPGQQPMSSSAGVVIASDQTPVSVAGTVNIGNSILNTSGSVVAFQGTNPWVVTGSVQGFPSNQSISGTVNIGTIPGSVVSFQGGPWSASVNTGNSSVIVLIQGSVATVGTAAANQSVSGTVGASIIGWVPTQPSNTSTISYIQNSVAAVIIGGSIAATSVPPANQSVSGTVNIGTMPGSVVAFQGGSWSSSVTTGSASVIVLIQGSVATVGTAAANQSVSGTVGASIIGWMPIQASNTSVISYIQNSVATVIIGGSIAATSVPPANQSVSGTVGASLIGLSPVSVSNFPTNQNVSGSVVSFQGGAWSASVTTGNASVIALIQGSIAAFQGGTNITSISGNVNVQGINAPVTSITGNPVYVGGRDGNGSITGATLVTVASIAVGNALLTNTIIPANSVVGTYAKSGAQSATDKGILTYGQRNDTLASIISADTNYGPPALGPSGESISTNAPYTKWVQGVGDLRVVTGASVTVIAAQGASIFTYVTGGLITNYGPASVLVTLSGATSSIIGYVGIGVGTTIPFSFQNGLKTNANAAFAASLSGTASVLVTATGFSSKS